MSVISLGEKGRVMFITMVFIFFVFVLNLIFANYFYFTKVGKNQELSALPSIQIRQIKQYLQENKVGFLELYFLKYSVFINFLLLSSWLYILINEFGEF